MTAYVRIVEIELHIGESHDLKAKRNALPADGLSKLKAEYIDKGGHRTNEYDGWVRADA